MDWLKEMYEDHCIVLRISNLLAAYSGKLEKRRGNPGMLGEITGLGTAFIERCHHGKEEKALFPVIGKHGRGGIAALMREHARGRRLMQAIRDGTKGEKISGIRAYGALIRAHIRKENALFNGCYGKVGEKEGRALSAAFRRINSSALGKKGINGILCGVAKLEAAVEKL